MQPRQEILHFIDFNLSENEDLPSLALLFILTLYSSHKVILKLLWVCLYNLSIVFLDTPLVCNNYPFQKRSSFFPAGTKLNIKSVSI